MKVTEILNESFGDLIHQLFQAMSGNMGWTPALIAYAVVYATYRASVSSFYLVLTKLLLRKIGVENDKLIATVKDVYRDIREDLGEKEAKVFRDAIKEMENALMNFDSEGAAKAVHKMQAIRKQLANRIELKVGK